MIRDTMMLALVGQKIWMTPHMDQLFEAGMKFNYFYANSPVCSPRGHLCLPDYIQTTQECLALSEHMQIIAGDF
jgi:hypothetical protein